MDEIKYRGAYLGTVIKNLNHQLEQTRLEINQNRQETNEIKNQIQRLDQMLEQDRRDSRDDGDDNDDDEASDEEYSSALDSDATTISREVNRKKDGRKNIGQEDAANRIGEGGGLENLNQEQSKFDKEPKDTCCTII